MVAPKAAVIAAGAGAEGLLSLGTQSAGYCIQSSTTSKWADSHDKLLSTIVTACPFSKRWLSLELPAACRRVAKNEPYRLTGAAAPLAIKSQEHGRQPGSFIAGFIKGPDSAPATVFPPPQVPASYQPVHKFTEPLHAGARPCLRLSGLHACSLWPLLSCATKLLLLFLDVCRTGAASHSLAQTPRGSGYCLCS